MPSKTQIDAKKVTSLLYPIAAFIRAGGISKTEAVKIFAEAFEKVPQRRQRRKMDHIGDHARYADVIASWSKKRRFLDAHGWPRPLTFSGPSSFSELVHSVDRRANPDIVLSVLKRYGNVRRTRGNTYALISPFFNTSGPTMMAYEPAAYFLSDAATTLGRILSKSKYDDGPALFWQKTDNAWISESTARKFNSFARERSLIFLDEMDEWLEAHSSHSRRGRDKRRRIGLGLFSIYSDREDFDPESG